MAATVVLGLAVPMSGQAQAAGPSLTVSMQVDKVIAKRGDRLMYEIDVQNVGDADALQVEVTSHIPSQTTEADTDCPTKVDTCVHVNTPTPGLGDSTHQIDIGTTFLHPGQTFVIVFAVTINDDAVVGSHILDHAHATAVGQTGTVTSETVDTLVVGQTPDGAFGGSQFVISGGGGTDSYDSSLGPYTASNCTALAATCQGNVKSNGNITISGGAVIKGDAIAGGSVSLSGGSVVTGSIVTGAPALALSPVDASPYESDNDNFRICALPGSCTATTYAPATRSLSVGGSATLSTGVYYLCNLSVSGSLTIDGQAMIWMGSPEDCSSIGATFGAAFKGDVMVASGSPKDFQLRVQGSSSKATTISISGGHTFNGVTYAPLSALSMSGGSVYDGDLVCGSVATGSGGGYIHRDVAALR